MTVLSEIQAFRTKSLRPTQTNVTTLCDVLRIDPQATVHVRPGSRRGELFAEIKSFGAERLRSTETSVKNLADVVGNDRSALMLATTEEAPDAPSADGRALPADERTRARLTAPAAAMHGRCFGFEVERSTWDAPLLAVHSSAEARPGYASMSKSEYVDTEATLNAKVAQLARLLRQAKKPVFYCGAGLSTAAGIGDYASSTSASLAGAGPQRQTFRSPLCAQPTVAHRVLVGLRRAGMLHRLVQQNHDGLPQKAGMPQEALNEIHGAIHSPDNPVVPMAGSLREDLFADLLACEEQADLSVAVGTSLCGMNADRVVSSPAARAAAGAGLGAVVIGLQRTVMDADATLRIFAKIDDVFERLAAALGLLGGDDGQGQEPLVPPARAEGTFFCPAVLRGSEAGGPAYLLRGLKYDAAGRRLDDDVPGATGACCGLGGGGRDAPDGGSLGGGLSLDLRDGASLVIPSGMHAGATGEVDGYDREGNPRCRFQLRLKKGKNFKAASLMPLGSWHLQAAADATLAQLAVVNPPKDEDESEAARALRALVAAYT